MENKQAVIFAIVQIALAAITILAALIYSLPILCIRRFQHRNNIFTLNVCLRTMLCCVVYAFSFPSFFLHGSFAKIHPRKSMVHLAASILRYFDDRQFRPGLSPSLCCSIVFHQTRFFRTKQWVMAMSWRPMDTGRLCLWAFLSSST